MMPINNDDDGEDVFDTEDTGDDTAPDPGDQRPDLPAEHDALIGDLSGIESPKDEADLKADHDDAITDLSFDTPKLSPADSTKAIVDTSSPVTPTPAQPGRYYVPPEQRTPGNRADRRAEHDRILNEMRSGVERSIAPPVNVPEFEEDFGDRQQESFDTATQGIAQDYKTGQNRTNQAALNMFSTLTDATLDIAHNLELLRIRLEQDRL